MATALDDFDVLLVNMDPKLTLESDKVILKTYFSTVLTVNEPRGLSGMLVADLLAEHMPEKPLVRACIRMCVTEVQVLKAAELAARTSSAQVLTQTPPAAQNAGSSSDTGLSGAAEYLRVLGPEPSSLAMTAAILAGRKEVMYTEVLDRETATCFKGLPYHLRPGKEGLQMLETYAIEARKRTMVPFHLAVDLTAKVWLAPWLPPGCTGGSTKVGSDCMTDKGLHSLMQLGNDLKSAFAQPRWFRSAAHWQVTWWRYTPLAALTGQTLSHSLLCDMYCSACTGHTTMNQALMHWNTIMRLFDKLQTAGLEHHQAVLYDSLCRERWQQRLEDKDPAFKFDEVVVNTDKELWSVAEQRLPEVLKAAGITASAYPVTMGTTMVYSPPNGSLAGGNNPYKAQKEEAEAATRKAEAAEHRMKAAQRIYDEKKQSLLSSSDAGHTALSQRQEKNCMAVAVAVAGTDQDQDLGAGV